MKDYGANHESKLRRGLGPPPSSHPMPRRTSIVAGMPGGVMVGVLEGEGEQRDVLEREACALRHLHASCGNFIVIVGGPG